MTEIVLYFVVFLYGLLIGSFLNVCIYRIPKKESIVVVRSHCMNCGYQLKWYDLFPVFSYLFLGGKCRKCKTKISKQYPLIELLNSILYVWVFLVNGTNVLSVLYCLLASALLVLTVIDLQIYEIPDGINLFIFILGFIRLLLDLKNWPLYVIGFFSVGLFLLILYVISGGRWIGGGDVKLMAAAGLLIGWQLIILGFFTGCVFGSIIHLVRMKISKEDRVLAFGPYLSLGIFLTMLYGQQWIRWYLDICLG